MAKPLWSLQRAALISLCTQLIANTAALSPCSSKVTLLLIAPCQYSTSIPEPQHLLCSSPFIPQTPNYPEAQLLQTRAACSGGLTWH